MTPRWVAEHVGRTSGWHGLGRYAFRRSCKTCRRPVLAGLDEQWAALPAVVDPDPLGVHAEALALLAGRKTYALRDRSGRLELTYRDQWQTTGNSQAIPGNRFEVVAEHRCGERGDEDAR